MVNFNATQVGLISIHALCEEGDLQQLGIHPESWKFLSTPSARRATPAMAHRRSGHRHFYPRPLRGGRPSPMNFPLLSKAISIHALCEEGDNRGAVHDVDFQKFLSTPSARRATATFFTRVVKRVKFLSTPSARRATCRHAASTAILSYFYPRPLRGGRPRCAAAHLCDVDFYPRPLRGGRRGRLCGAVVGQLISIHALCEEGDLRRGGFRGGGRNFYPRPLRGGRLYRHLPWLLCRDFYPRPLRGGRLSAAGCTRQRIYFYPRPLRGGRLMALPSLSRMAYFYPRPLRGGRPCVVLIINQFVIISIHALCEEGDGGHGAGPHHHLRISNHALCEEGDPCRPPC